MLDTTVAFAEGMLAVTGAQEFLGVVAVAGALTLGGAALIWFRKRPQR